MSTSLDMDLRVAFEHWVSSAPRAAAITDTLGRRWERAEFYERLLRFGSAMYAVGLEPGDRVAILDGVSRRHIEAEYGAMIAGLVRVSLDPANSPNDHASVIADSGARVLVYEPSQARNARRVGQLHPNLLQVGDGGGLNYEDLLANSGSEELPALSRATVASLGYSGGTTGKPKAIVHTHGNILSVVRNILMAHPGEEDGTFLNVRPLWPTGAFIVLARLIGGAHVAMERFSQKTFGELVAKHEARMTSLVPTQLIRYFDTGPDLNNCASLSVIDVGSSAILVRDFLEIIDSLGPKIGVPYGMTEAPWSTYLSPGALASKDTRELLTHSCGRPLGDAHVRILSATETDVTVGEVGEIAISGANVMEGYWNMPERTAAAFSKNEHYYKTGDLGYVDEDGFLYVRGRVTDQIRTGGKTVFPGDVEAILMQHRDVAHVAVAGVPDREWGEIVCGFVVLRAGSAVAASELISFCRARLPGYKTPKLIVLRASLPKSSSYGKVLRKSLVDEI